MRTTSLEDRSLTELRAMAQAMSAKFDFSFDKRKLIDTINATVAAKVPAPKALDPIAPRDNRLAWKPPRHTSTEDEVIDILAVQIAQGLAVTFPTPDTWHFQRALKEDSGTMNMPLKDVVECARRMMR